MFEDAFLRFVRRHGLPLPEVNQRVAGHEVDMLWRRERLIVELDGRAYHDDHAFERDRDRDADLQAAGHRVVRVTWPRLPRAPVSSSSQAEGVGFEPTVPGLPVQRFSRPPDSTTLAPLRMRPRRVAFRLNDGT